MKDYYIKYDMLDLEFSLYEAIKMVKEAEFTDDAIKNKMLLVDVQRKKMNIENDMDTLANKFNALEENKEEFSKLITLFAKVNTLIESFEAKHES